MALPTYADPLERAWYYTYRTICVLIFLFLIAPILVVIPLSFNVEPYFTFTEKMLTLDPEGYSLRWYDALLTLGHPAPETARDATWWAAAWERATWVQAAKNSFWVGLWATILATTLGTIAALGLSRPEMPYRRLIMALLISPMIVPIIIIAVGMSFFFAKACVAPDSAMGMVFGPLLSNKGCLVNSQLGVIMAHAVLGIPFVIITVTATLTGFDESLMRASAMFSLARISRAVLNRMSPCSVSISPRAWRWNSATCRLSSRELTCRLTADWLRLRMSPACVKLPASATA